MKRKILSILLTLVLVLSFSLVTAVPAAAQDGAVTNTTTMETFNTIQDAIDDADTLDGHTIEVGAGNWFGAVVNKAVEIRGKDGAVIDDGPAHSPWKDGFRLVSGSSGATISHFTFQVVELPIYGWGPDDVTIEHNKIFDTTQGITNWDGDGWVIKHNVIEGIAVSHNGGGIGICVGSRGDDVSGNIVAHNKIVGHFPDKFAFSVGGILLCTDERKVPPGIVSNNKIVHNKVKATGIDCWAISLQLIPPAGGDPLGTLRDNIVGFNDLRGSDVCIGYYPDAETLEPFNIISRNLGGENKNRGRGEVPANIFKPV